MRIKPILGWLALFLFAATAEARSLGALGRKPPLPAAAVIATGHAR